MRSQGHVLLVVGEMDNTVDPSSTMQVVNQLIKHKRFDFFVRHLRGASPPDWTDLDRKATRSEQDEEMP